ncbi:MAG: C39 family peptidase [Anaerolineaceae bacterium]|nr:C39 family peptidase [Anaerolineaceae bacterium]
MESDFSEQKNTSSLSDWTAERQYFGRFYLSQGFTKKRQFTNDCGPTSLSVTLNMLLFQANPGASRLEKNAVIQSAGLLFWDRLPGWVPKVGGATAPWGMAKAFNQLAARMNLDWRAERKSHARRAHIIEVLMTGRPVSALKLWKAGGAHWVTLVRYSSEKDKLYYLDPNPFLEYLPVDKRLQSQTWAEFEADWSCENWWSRLLGIKNELVIFSKTS